MTWEIVLGLFTLLSAFLAVFNIVVKVNRTLCSLEISVNRLNEFIEKQTDMNEKFLGTLTEHGVKIARIEDKIAAKVKNSGIIRKECT